MKLMSESECIFYIAVVMLIMVGLVIYADRQRMQVERLRRQLRREREQLSRLLHPAQKDPTK